LKPTKIIHYFNILWNSTIDGPGIRTVLFLQGCHLNCPWCHSPHSQDTKPKILFFEERCTYCGSCEKACKNHVHRVVGKNHYIDRSKCIRCRDCIHACPTVSSESGLSGALALPDTFIEPGKLFDKLYPQLDLLKKIGGLTISGGEPLLQFISIKELLKLCKDKEINTAIETSGSVPLENIKYLTEYIDIWLFGLRPLSDDFNQSKIPNIDLVELNLKYLVSIGKKKIIIRMPLIPTYTDSPEQITKVISIMNRCGLGIVELLPFNEYAGHYYTALGEVYEMNSIIGENEQDLRNVINKFKEFKIEAKIIIQKN
jgi:glycyl-radical enzyme activating protein